MTGKKLLKRKFEVNSTIALPLHNLFWIFGHKILLRSLAKSVSHMACFDRFLFLRVWPSLRFPFLKTAGINPEKKLSGSKRNNWGLKHAFSCCRRLLTCCKFSVTVNLIGMTVQVNFCGGNIHIWRSGLRFNISFIFLVSRILTIYNNENPDLWYNSGHIPPPSWSI